jgi:CheY-like chemotaxis protein/tetratricopeptide (TPR) repeat protein
VPRILLAEGHGPTSELVAGALSQAGHQVVTAGDALRAYELFASQRPDVVVLAADLGGGALELAQRLREANSRVVLLVTDREHLGKARGLQALLPFKANAYVPDPTQRVLVDKVQALVAQLAPERPRGTTRVLARAPTSRGEVKPGVVPGLFHQIWRSLAEGILVVDGAGPARHVCFRQGVPVMAGSEEPEESLLPWLRQTGRIAPEVHAAAVEAMAGGLSSGAALIAAGVVEPGPPLQALLTEHLEALVARTIAARDGRWRFHPGGEFLADGPAVEVLPLRAILAGARLGLAPRHFTEALKAVTDAYPVRTADFPQVLPAAGLSSADLRMALSLDGRLTTREWLAARAAELKDALSLLWFLSMIGAAVFQEEPEEADAYGKHVPRRRRPLPPERAEAIRQAAMRILPGTHLSALGVDLDTDGAAVEQAYRTIAARFHPDAFAEYEMEELADLLTAIQDKLSAAYRVLSDAERRRAYLEYLVQRLEQTGARRPGPSLEAEMALKRGQRALLRRRHPEAVIALRDAVQRNGKEPEYLALLAFALLFDPGSAAAAPANAEEARKLARRALALAPDHPRAMAAMALAEEVLGDPAEARRITLAGLAAHPQSEVLKRMLFRLNRARG